MITRRLKGRPRKKKIVGSLYGLLTFEPGPDEAIVTMEEYEAMRLSDYMGMQQKKAASMMGISQQSFSRIVRVARKKVSDAIVNAKIIRIEGGDFVSKQSMDLASKLKRKD